MAGNEIDLNDAEVQKQIAAEVQKQVDVEVKKKIDGEIKKQVDAGIQEFKDNYKPESNISAEDKKLFDETVDEKVSERLKEIKTKLDKAYEGRDAALQQVKEYEEEKRKVEIKALEDSGKTKEAYELKLQDEQAKSKALESKNIKLTRDLDLKNILRKFDFRNANAQEMVFSQIVKDLVQDDGGTWTHRSGIAMDSYVDKFMEKEENSFLLKPRQNNGSGGSANSGSAANDKAKSLFDMTQEEVIEQTRKRLKR